MRIKHQHNKTRKDSKKCNEKSGQSEEYYYFLETLLYF